MFIFFSNFSIKTHTAQNKFIVAKLTVHSLKMIWNWNEQQTKMYGTSLMNDAVGAKHFKRIDLCLNQFVWKVSHYRRFEQLRKSSEFSNVWHSWIFKGCVLDINWQVNARDYRKKSEMSLHQIFQIFKYFKMMTIYKCILPRLTIVQVHRLRNWNSPSICEREAKWNRFFFVCFFFVREERDMDDNIQSR